MQEEEILAQKVHRFPVLYGKREKGFEKRDMVQNAWEGIAKNWNFVENSNFIREITEAAVRSCSGVNSEQNTHNEVLLSKSYKPAILILRTLTQFFSCEVSFLQNIYGRLLLELVWGYYYRKITPEKIISIYLIDLHPFQCRVM